MKIRNFFRALWCFVTGRWEIQERSVIEPSTIALNEMLMLQSTDRLRQLRRCETRFEEHLAAWKANIAHHAEENARLLASLQEFDRENTRLRDQVARLALSARLWDGLIGCARMTWMGHAGFIKPEESGYLHIGLNFWNIHEDHGDVEARDLLTRFAESAASIRESALAVADDSDKAQNGASPGAAGSNRPESTGDGHAES